MCNVLKEQVKVNLLLVKSYEKLVKSLNEIQRFRNPYTHFKLGVGTFVSSTWVVSYIAILHACNKVLKFNNELFKNHVS